MWHLVPQMECRRNSVHHLGRGGGRLRLDHFPPGYAHGHQARWTSESSVACTSRVSAVSSLIVLLPRVVHWYWYQ